MTFVTVDESKVCDMSKISEFCPVKYQTCMSVAQCIQIFFTTRENMLHLPKSMDFAQFLTAVFAAKS